MIRRASTLCLLGLLLALGSPHAGVRDPVTGDAFVALVAAQRPDAQGVLDACCERLETDSTSFLVTGPLDPAYDGDPRAGVLFHSIRVISQDRDALAALVAALRTDTRLGGWRVFADEPRQEVVAGFRGVLAELQLDGQTCSVLVLSENENRWLVWVRDVRSRGIADVESGAFARYAVAVSDHLHGQRAQAPHAEDFDLPPAADLYPPRPDYVIQGYQNYLDFLYSHAELHTRFADGILAFVPGDSLRDAMTDDPPPAAWPNKEEPVIQHEYRTFFERGGDTSALRTLNAARLQTLVPGEYFFCVGVSGRVRFGYELPREAVERVERETGRKLPRANHAFLFPGEPVLCAGAFFVEADGAGTRHITEVNAQSGHYFYSNVSPTVREDIARRSDGYVMTLGHFLAALDRLGIDHRRLVMSKM